MKTLTTNQLGVNNPLVNCHPTIAYDENSNCAKKIAGKIIVLNNSLVNHNLSVIRDKNSDCEKFNNAVKRVAYALILEAANDIPTTKKEIETPIEKTICKVFDTSYQLIIAPILRAGLIFGEIAQELMPFANIHHLGMYRNEETLEPVCYYDKNKKIIENKAKVRVFIVDPMLATGNSGIDAIGNFISKGIKEENITFISLISSPFGIEKMQKRYPKTKIITSCVDKDLNSKGYIIPGLGDAGDRIYNTL